MDIRTRVGRNIRRLRVDAEMSQEMLAVYSKLETVYLSRIERGVANPTVRVLERVARALRVDSGEFFRIETVRTPVGNLQRGRKPARVRR